MPRVVSKRRAVAVAAAAGALSLGSLAAASTARAAGPRVTIAGTHPEWAVTARPCRRAGRPQPAP